MSNHPTSEAVNFHNHFFQNFKSNMAQAREYDNEMTDIKTTKAIRLSFNFHFDLIRGLFNTWEMFSNKRIIHDFDESKDQELPCAIIETFEVLLDQMAIHRDACKSILEYAKETKA